MISLQCFLFNVRILRMFFLWYLNVPTSLWMSLAVSSVVLRIVLHLAFNISFTFLATITYIHYKLYFMIFLRCHNFESIIGFVTIDTTKMPAINAFVLLSEPKTQYNLTNVFYIFQYLFHFCLLFLAHYNFDIYHL